MLKTSGPAKLYLPAAVAAAAVIAITVLFANATSTDRLTNNARELHHTNATLGSAALARAAAGQVAVFADLEKRGLASPRSVEAAREELEETAAALEELTAGMADPPADLERLEAALARRPIDRTAVDAAYRPVADRLAERIVLLEGEIERSDRLGDYLSAAIRLVVVLVIPAAAIVVYRRRVANQIRATRLKWEAQLEAEREISRAKDQFVAGMSHEIRTPLTGICGFSEVLLDMPADAPLDRETVELIHSEAADLSRMVDDFIAASRIDGATLEIDRQPVDMLEVARSVADRFRRRGAEISIEGDGGVAWCDRGRTHHVLTNLLANAVQHGGDTVTVTMESDASTVQCHVTDDGDGVPPEMRDRLFTRFLHEGDGAVTAGSLGLGTWVARELARAMDGDVTFRQADATTVFTLAVPAAVADEPGSAVPVEAGATA